SRPAGLCWRELARSYSTIRPCSGPTWESRRRYAALARQTGRASRQRRGLVVPPLPVGAALHPELSNCKFAELRRSRELHRGDVIRQHGVRARLRNSHVGKNESADRTALHLLRGGLPEVKRAIGMHGGVVFRQQSGLPDDVSPAVRSPNLLDEREDRLGDLRPDHWLTGRRWQ